MGNTLAHWKRLFKSAFVESHALQRLLSFHSIEQRCDQAGQRWRQSFWSPGLTMLTFLLQTLNSAKTLRAAVADTLGQFKVDHPDDELPSADPSAYCQARQKLPKQVVADLVRDVCQQTQAMAGEDQLWCGHRVIMIDGSNVSMPDEPQLQEAFPQPPGQSTGCGFPIGYLTVLFDWASGVVLDHRLGQKSEMTMFRAMLDHFKPGDVALADRYYCSYVDIARLQQRGVHVVMRLHQRRCSDFRQGTPLDRNDRLVTWERPPKWLASMGISPEVFESLSHAMTLRMVRTTKAPKGFRSREIIIVTTLLDPDEVSADQLLTLYRDRWMVELNLRSLKTTLNMQVLRSQSLAMIRKELLMHLLLYNLLRLLMWEAARNHARDPHRLSFAGTLHRLQSLGPRLTLGMTDQASKANRDSIMNWLLTSIAGDVLPDRPDRFEPRRVKRRPKNYSRMTKPRTHYHRHGDLTCR